MHRIGKLQTSDPLGPVCNERFAAQDRACKSAIRSGDKITSVYPVFGFRDYSAFYRAFRKEYGISPKEYREMLEKLEAMSGSD